MSFCLHSGFKINNKMMLAVRRDEFINNEKKSRVVWNDEEDEELREAILVRKITNWNKVATYFDDKTASQCRAR